MFLCVSPNPAVDKRITLQALVPGGIHRAGTVQSFPGGKSTHVAMVLKALGAEPHWIGMVGGATGEQALAGLCGLGVVPHSVPVKSETRTNLEIIESSAAVTEIREPGEPVSADEVAAFEHECKAMFNRGAGSMIAIFSGSLPPGAPEDLYARLITVARSAGCRTLLDASGEPLRMALSAHPDFVKPNHEEAAAVFNSSVDSTNSAAEAVRRLIDCGARSAAISLGAAGMIYGFGQNAPTLFAPAVPLKPHSTVACGDAALAGFAYSFSLGAAPAQALRTAVACASANCLAESPGAVRPEVIKDFETKVRIETFSAAP